MLCFEAVLGETLWLIKASTWILGQKVVLHLLASEVLGFWVRLVHREFGGTPLFPRPRVPPAKTKIPCPHPAPMVNIPLPDDTVDILPPLREVSTVEDPARLEVSKVAQSPHDPDTIPPNLPESTGINTNTNFSHLVLFPFNIFTVNINVIFHRSASSSNSIKLIDDLRSLYFKWLIFANTM